MFDLTLSLPVVISGFIISLCFGWFLNLQRTQKQLTSLQVELARQEGAIGSLEQQLVMHAHEKESHQQAYDTLQLRHTDLTRQFAALKSMLETKEQNFKEQLQHIEHSKSILKQEFENLANEILDRKGKAFKELNQESIWQLLKPVQHEMQGFRQKVESIHSEELKQRAELKNELVNLQKLNLQITDQADRLTNALQGQKKIQGNWGELMLENVLDNAGLRLGTDYKREVSFTTENGRSRPDVVVYLPQNKHLVIDAKTSLAAYTRYVNAENEFERQQSLNAHAQAITDRINELSDRDYYKLPGLNSPEVVIMFIPVESAYVEALKSDPSIYQKALERNVLVATPTTLLTSLNIVRQLWRFEDQNKHTAELANRAERFYTKLTSFLASMQEVGKQLDKAKVTYDKAFSQLYSGKGNLIKQAADFKELGVSVQRELPEELVELAQLEVNMSNGPQE